VLDGSFSEKGVLAPMTSKINDPLIEEPRKDGIFLVEKIIS
jgi:saccharopine dehydrogenase (NADP+, L-glutamate forming)